MAEIKTRYPNQLTDENYDEWFTRWAAWFLAFPSTPEFANWLRAGVNALDADFHDKRIAALAAETKYGNRWHRLVVAYISSGRKSGIRILRNA